jgi:hypothetical protein
MATLAQAVKFVHPELVLFIFVLLGDDINPHPISCLGGSPESSFDITMGSIPRRGKNFFSTLQCPDRLGPTKPPIQWVPTAHSSGGKVAGA